MSKPGTKPPRKTESPSIDESRRTIAVDITRDVVAHYHEAVKQYEKAVERCSDDRTLDPWVVLLSSAMNDARSLLIRAILGWHHGGNHFNVMGNGEERYFPPCSIEVNRVLYAAVPDADEGIMEVGETRDDRCHVMQLVIIPPGSNTELDTDADGWIIPERRKRLDGDEAQAQSEIGGGR